MTTIFDLDGCVADDRRRRPLLTSGYDEYHRDSGADPAANADVVRAALEEGTITFLTARPEALWDQTYGWIRRNFPFIPQEKLTLIMRPEGDNRGSVEMKCDLVDTHIGATNVVRAFDDREDVVKGYRAMGIPADVLRLPTDAADMLGEMAQTYMERGVVYKDNYKRVAPVIKALWPDGVPSELVTKDHWHLFEMMIVKLTRFATSGLTHQDSIHDAAVYAAMIESELRGGGQ